MEKIQISSEDEIETTIQENVTSTESKGEAVVSSKNAPDVIYTVARNFYEPEVFVDEMERMGFSYVGREDRGHLMKELQGQPCFAGLYGPFWGGLNDSGRVVILYEDKETYRIRST